MLDALYPNICNSLLTLSLCNRLDCLHFQVICLTWLVSEVTQHHVRCHRQHWPPNLCRPYTSRRPTTTHTDEGRKFGKQIQRRQLDLPEYAAVFVNYKALKKVGGATPGFDLYNEKAATDNYFSI